MINIKKSTAIFIAILIMTSFISVCAEENEAVLVAEYKITSPDVFSWGGWGYYYGTLNESGGTSYPLTVHETPGTIAKLNADAAASNYGFNAEYPQLSINSEEFFRKFDGEISYETYVKINSFTFDRSGIVSIGGCYASDTLGHTALYVNKDGALILRRNFDSGYIEFKPADAINSKINLNKFYHIAFSYDPSSVENMPVFYINGVKYESAYNVEPLAGGVSGNALTSEDFTDTSVHLMRLAPDTYNTNQHSYANSTWVMSAFYTGILSENQIKEKYSAIVENNSNQYSISVTNNGSAVSELQNASISEGELKIVVDATGIDTQSLKSGIKLNGESVEATVSGTGYTVLCKFIEAGDYTLSFDKGIKKANSDEVFRNTDKSYSFTVSENTALRSQLIGEINSILADTSKTNEAVMNEIISDYNYALKLDVGSDSDYSKIINKADIFGNLRTASYTDIPNFVTAFESQVTAQAEGDVRKGVQEVVEMSNSSDTDKIAKLQNLLFTKYQTVFNLDLTEYNTLTNKDKAIEKMFNLSCTSVSEIKTKFLEAVAAQKKSEREQAFADGLKTQTIDSVKNYLGNNIDLLDIDLQNEDFKAFETAVLTDVLWADISAPKDVTEVFYKSVLLHSINGVQLGNREKTKTLLTTYSQYWTVPDSYKNATNEQKEALYRNITDGRTYTSLSDMEGQIATEMSSVINAPQTVVIPSVPAGGGGGGGMSFSDSKKTSSFEADETISETDVPATEVEAKTPFGDLENVPWAVIAIENLYEKGIINGKSETEFAPNEQVTRAEIAKMMSLAFEITAVPETLNLSDLSETDWSYPYVAALYNAKIINGVNENTFGKNDYLTRADLAVILKRIADRSDIEYSEENELFNDDANIPEYAKEAVYNMKDLGIINGIGNNTYNPYGIVTRAEAAKVINLLMSL